MPRPDGIGRIAVTPKPLGSTGGASDNYLEVLIEGYPNLNSTGYGQITAVVVQKQTIDPASYGGFASISYRESAKHIQGGGQGQATGVAIKQDGNVYIAKVEITPETDWTPKFSGDHPVLAAAFDLLQGSGAVKPDISASGAPFQIGFFRANSGPAPSNGGVQIVGIDDLVIVLNPHCTSAAECGDDGTGCTTETCTGGVCGATVKTCIDGNACTVDGCDLASGACPFTAVPDGTPCDDNTRCNGHETCRAGRCTPGAAPNCDDGNTCTSDACDARLGCTHRVMSSFRVAGGKVKDFQTLVSGKTCSGNRLVKKLRALLIKKITQARAKVHQADASKKVPAISKLIEKAYVILIAVRQRIDAAQKSGDLTPECAAKLLDLLQQVQQCVLFLPRVP